MRSPSKGVLFLCVANSARSQMAEVLLRELAGNALQVFSAGSAPASQVHPLAVQAVRELGLDPSSLRPKAIGEIDPAQVGTVITLCAEEVCPVFPHEVERIHWPLVDPAKASGSLEQQLEAFRQVREELRTRIAQWLAEQNGVRALSQGKP